MYPAYAANYSAFNNIIIGFSKGIGLGGNTGSTTRVYNNTIINCLNGIFCEGAGTAIAVNNLFYGCTHVTLNGYSTFSAGTDYNSAENSSMEYTVTGGGNSHDRVSQTFTFVDSGNADYHLSGLDAGARGYGVTNPSSGLFLDDIDGNTRIVPWDIGADDGIRTVTKTVKTALASGDYTTLAAWESDRNSDLVTNKLIEVAECYNFEDTTAVTIDGWTTDSGNYIEIKGADSDRTASNTGKWSTDRYRLVISTSNFSIPNQE
ncbi:MAG: hypothetical protein RLZZ469_2038, partial [Bacteroidota bacterium]